VLNDDSLARTSSAWSASPPANAPPKCSRNFGSLVKEEPYQNNLGYSERADVPIESRLSEQWFLKYPSVKESQAVVAMAR
jgi:hypothetical protein